MASNTERFGLLKKDPIADGNDTFNIQTMLNDNWDKLDEAAKKSELDEHTGDTTVHITATDRDNWNAKETPAGAQAKADQAEQNAKDYTDQEIVTHLADYVMHPGYGVATGSANTYSINLNPAPTSYIEGMAISVKINVDNTGPSTINVNGLGAKAIKKPNGNDVSAGNLKAGSIYTLRYNGTNFILQGEGGEYGTATAADVLEGKTIGTDSGIVTGTMPNNGAITITPTTTDQAIPAGYHNGTGIVKGDPDLIPSNIKQGVNIFGVVGTLNPKYTLSRKQTIKGSFSSYVTPQGQTLSWRYNTHTVSFAPKFIVMTFNYTQRTAVGGSSHPEVAFWINPEVLGVDGTTVKTSDLSHSANGNGNDAWNDVTQFYTILITNVSGNTFQIGQQSYKTDFTYMQSYFASQSYTVTVYG